MNINEKCKLFNDFVNEKLYISIKKICDCENLFFFLNRGGYSIYWRMYRDKIWILIKLLRSVKSARYPPSRPRAMRHWSGGTRRGRKWKSDLVTSKFNKRHKPIQPAIRAAKTRRAIKAVIKRSPFSRPARGWKKERGWQKRGRLDLAVRSLACTVVSQKVRRAGTH